MTQLQPSWKALTVPEVRDSGIVFFGSVARGDARPDSDVDLLYMRVPGNDLGTSYFALQDDLEKLFGRPVDLVPKEGLHRIIRDQVLADAQVLYAA
jgi:predicted nucleotidyltransferase